MDYAVVGKKTERVLALCRRAGATVYLSGPAASAYLDEESFVRAGIQLEWMDYAGYAEYRQSFSPFVHEVSVVDLILNEGPEAPGYMKSFARPWETASSVGSRRQ